MRYDDNSDDARSRRDDEQRPSRNNYGEPPRSRQPSRPSPSDDSSRMPSRPRGDSTSRPRGDGRDYESQQRRPRNDDSDRYAGQSPRQRSSAYDELRSRGQDLGRRMRDGMSSMYEAVSREFRSVRDNMNRGRRSNTGEEEDNRSSQRVPSRSRNDSAYAPRYNEREEYRENYQESHEHTHMQYDHPVIDNGKHGRALVMRLRRRRQIVRGSAVKSQGTSAKWGIAFLSLIMAIIVGLGSYLGYDSAALVQRYNYSISLVGQNRDFSSTNIYDRNGVLLYSAFNHNDPNAGVRFYLDYCQIPEEVKWATIDTEDSTFWSNPGVNYTAELRALYVDAVSHGAILGASTITQQVVKAMVLNDNQKSIQRKLDEALISLDIGQIYSKQQILTAYLNQINYGSDIYGIEAAARKYFHLGTKTVSLAKQDYSGLTPDEKSFVDQVNMYSQTDQLGGTPCLQKGQTTVIEPAAWQLQPWQAALLAGVPQSPDLLNPFLHPIASLTRMQTGVLPNVYKNGHQQYFQLNGKNTTQQDLYNAAYAAIRMPGNGDPSTYQRQIYPPNSADSGTNRELAPFFVDYVISELSKIIPGGFDQIASSGWNIYTTLDYGNPDISDSELNQITLDKSGKLTGLPDNRLSQVGLEQYAEFITKRDIQGTTTNGIPNSFPDYWYCGGFTNAIQYYSGSTNPFGNNNWCLEQSLNRPLSQGGSNVFDGALTAIDPRNGDILAMVGGVDYYSTDKMTGGQNNVATASRSLGSSFKPLVYATAFEMGWNPGTVIRDQPTCFPNASDPTNQPAADQYICGGHYVPHNYSTSEWAGPQPLTYLLGNSLNPPAELTLNFTGLRDDNSAPFPNMAQRLGVTTLNPTQFGPTTALGAQVVPLLEETSAYGTLANNGVRHPQRYILTITTATGDPIYNQATGQQLFKYDPNPPGYQAVSPQAAYMVTSILTNKDARVGDFGPHTPLNYYGRDVAAKTGTSQNVVDIVTMGYTPWLAIGVWAGNADGTPMKQNIIGIAGAAYIFNAVMNFAIDHYNMPGTKPGYNAPDEPGGYFPIPPDMHYAQLSCNTGMAFYPGEDPTKECNPENSPVPYVMSPDYNGNPMSTTKMPAFTTKVNNFCVNWGCLKDTNEGLTPFKGFNYAWLINGQDPTVP